MSKQLPKTPTGPTPSPSAAADAAQDRERPRKVVHLGKLDEFAEIPKGKILSVKLVNRPHR